MGQAYFESVIFQCPCPYSLVSSLLRSLHISFSVLSYLMSVRLIGQLARWAPSATRSTCFKNFKDIPFRRCVSYLCPAPRKPFIGFNNNDDNTNCNKLIRSIHLCNSGMNASCRRHFGAYPVLCTEGQRRQLFYLLSKATLKVDLQAWRTENVREAVRTLGASTSIEMHLHLIDKMNILQIRTWDSTYRFASPPLKC